MRRIAVAAGLIAAMCAGSQGSARAATLVSTTNPYPGVTHLVYEEASIPARIHVVVVDMSSAELSLHATRESERGKKISEYSLASGAQIVVNGDYFSLPDFRPAGLAMGAASLWAGASDDATSGFFRFDRNGDRTNASISPPEATVDPVDLPAGTQGVIGGRPMLVRAGMAETSFDCTDAIAMPCDRAPRTAVAVSDDGNGLFIAVVDGWQQGSLGMTAGELGSFLAGLNGVKDALMLDGGAASALYIAGEGGIVSSPSDGVERVVANHLGVRFGNLPPGQLIGFIRERDVFDEEANIAGATARLDNGDEVVTGDDGFYNFPMVTPRYACVTASAPGYRAETRCKQVTSGDIVYNSIPLFPHTDFIDAAPGAADASVADAGPGSPDAPPSGFDATIGPDANGGPPGDGCCSARDGTEATTAAILAVLVLLLCRRRSHTT